VRVRLSVSVSFSIRIRFSFGERFGMTSQRKVSGIMSGFRRVYTAMKQSFTAES